MTVFTLEEDVDLLEQRVIVWSTLLGNVQRCTLERREEIVYKWRFRPDTAGSRRLKKSSKKKEERERKREKKREEESDNCRGTTPLQSNVLGQASARDIEMTRKL